MEIEEVVGPDSLRQYIEDLPMGERWHVGNYTVFRCVARLAPTALSYFSPDLESHQKLAEGYPNGADAKVGFVAILAALIIPCIESSTRRRADLLQTRIEIAGAIKGIADVSTGRTAASIAELLSSAVSPEDLSASYFAASVLDQAETVAGQVFVTDVDEQFPPSEIWRLAREDLRRFSVDEPMAPLWIDGREPDWSYKALGTAEDRLDYEFDGINWTFWLIWFRRVRAGKPLYSSRLAEIVERMSVDEWRGDALSVNVRFGEVLRLYQRDDANDSAAPPRQSLAHSGEVARTKSAMSKHREELPPTFEAVLGFIELEVKRLQRINFQSETHKVEVLRQIEVLLSLHRAICGLMPLVPTSANMAERDAEKATGLVKLYFGKYAEWPRENADEMVDNSYRAALIGVSACMAPLVGVSPNLALAAGTAVFGGKRLAEGAKAAVELAKRGDK